MAPRLLLMVAAAGLIAGCAAVGEDIAETYRQTKSFTIGGGSHIEHDDGTNFIIAKRGSDAGELAAERCGDLKPKLLEFREATGDTLPKLIYTCE